MWGNELHIEGEVSPCVRSAERLGGTVQKEAHDYARDRQYNDGTARGWNQRWEGVH